MSLAAKRTPQLILLVLVVAVYFIPIYFVTVNAKIADEEDRNNTVVSGTEPTLVSSSITNYKLSRKPATVRKTTSMPSLFNNTTERSKVSTVDGGGKNTSICNGCMPIQVHLVRQVFLPNSSQNGTHVPMTKVHSRIRVLEYVLIPIGTLLLMFLLFVGFRHWQKVQKKKRLERELIHQYSYPNSEADEDLDYQNLPEVETVVNNQFVAYTDQSHKALLDDNLPEVAVSMGGASAKLVLQETPSTLEGAEHSANFNC